MDQTGIFILYAFLTMVYSCFPERVRPTTWWGWIAFVLVMLLATPVFALPVSMFVCRMWHYDLGGSNL